MNPKFSSGFKGNSPVTSKFTDKPGSGTEHTSEGGHEQTSSCKPTVVTDNDYDVPELEHVTSRSTFDDVTRAEDQQIPKIYDTAYVKNGATLSSESESRTMYGDVVTGNDSESETTVSSAENEIAQNGAVVDIVIAKESESDSSESNKYHTTNKKPRCLIVDESESESLSGYIEKRAAEDNISYSDDETDKEEHRLISLNAEKSFDQQSLATSSSDQSCERDDRDTAVSVDQKISMPVSSSVDDLDVDSSKLLHHGRHSSRRRSSDLALRQNSVINFVGNRTYSVLSEDGLEFKEDVRYLEAVIDDQTFQLNSVTFSYHYKNYDFAQYPLNSTNDDLSDVTPIFENIDAYLKHFKCASVTCIQVYRFRFYNIDKTLDLSKHGDQKSKLGVVYCNKGSCTVTITSAASKKVRVHLYEGMYTTLDVHQEAPPVTLELKWLSPKSDERVLVLILFNPLEG